jgi:ribosomal protein S18 acetylase RimI-like enzyme
LCSIERVDELRELWLDLHHHHRAVVGALPLVADDELSWARRRAMYLERLNAASGFLVVATRQDAGVGYALVCIEQGPDHTFPLGAQYAELYSLSVAPEHRGQGIGTQLLDFVDRELARRSTHDLKVAVMTANAGARRLYEGLTPAELVLYRFGDPRGRQRM